MAGARGDSEILLSYTRSTFWTVAVVTTLLGLSTLVTTRHAADRPIPAAITVFVALFVVGTGTVTGLAARALRRRGRFARTLVVLAGIYNLPLFPFGTVAAVVALWWRFSRKLRAVEPLVEDFDYQSKKGDTTHKWMQMAASAGNVAILLASLGVVGWWGERRGLPRNIGINGLVLLFICEWIAAFFHEMGHAAAGYIVGMRLAAFSVGPFQAHRHEGRWKFAFTLAPLIGRGGAVVTVPLHLQNLRSRMAIEIAAAIGLAPDSRFCRCLAFENAGRRLGNVMAASSIDSIDLRCRSSRQPHSIRVRGRLLRREHYWLNFSAADLFADMREALKMVGITTVTRTRPRNLDSAALSHAVTASNGTANAGMVRLLDLICAVDRNDLALARERLDSVLEVTPDATKVNAPTTAAEICFYVACLDGDATRGGEWLRALERMPAKKGRVLSQKFDYWRAVAAVRITGAREAVADEALRRARLLADRFPDTRLYAYETKLLDAVAERAWLRPLGTDRTEEPLLPSEAVVGA